MSKYWKGWSIWQSKTPRQPVQPAKLNAPANGPGNAYSIPVSQLLDEVGDGFGEYWLKAIDDGLVQVLDANPDKEARFVFRGER